MGHSVGTTLPLLCWEEARRNSVPGEHQSSTRHEEGKEKQVQGLEVGGGLGDGSEGGQDSQARGEAGPGGGGFSLFSKHCSQLLHRAVEGLHPEKAQLKPTLQPTPAFCVASISKTEQYCV